MTTHPDEMRLRHDSQIAALQAYPIDTFALETITPAGDVAPFMTFSMQAIVQDLVISRHDLRGQIDVATGRIGEWGRFAAHAHLVWRARRRAMKKAEATAYLEALEVCEEGEGKSRRRRTQAEIDALVLVDPDVESAQQAEEAAEAVFRTVDAVHNAYRAKSTALQADVYRARDGSMQRWSA